MIKLQMQHKFWSLVKWELQAVFLFKKRKNINKKIKINVQSRFAHQVAMAQ